MASAEQGTPRSEILSILRDVYGETRIKLDWAVSVDCRREEAKAAFLAIQCFESALPYGGTITVTRTDGKWHFTGLSPKLKFDPALWRMLATGDPVELEPKNVHYALLSATIAGLGRTIAVQQDESAITLSF